jgi:GNAT superfamily N-acetyltransferase
VQGLSIGEAERSDVPALVGLLGELFSQEREFTPDPSKQALGLLQILAHPHRGRIFVARRADELIAMAVLLFTISTAEGGPVALLEDVIVARPHRRRGVGKALLGHALCWAEDKGLLRLSLLTDPENAAAMQFYAGLGFVPSDMTALRWMAPRRLGLPG